MQSTTIDPQDLLYSSCQWCERLFSGSHLRVLFEPALLHGHSVYVQATKRPLLTAVELIGFRLLLDGVLRSA
ncbi:MAG TPA: hypothetical protein VFS21_27155 [Roseiflexaceae bacterium]|nr:hypothetical protein [Roseiflexaceae bacterium]